MRSLSVSWKRVVGMLRLVRRDGLMGFTRTEGTREDKWYFIWWLMQLLYEGLLLVCCDG